MKFPSNPRWASAFTLTGIAAAVALLVAVLAACASPAPRVFFVEPKTGATVSSPVHVKLGAEKFTIEPAGEVHPGAGHLHIMIDTDCVAVGQVIPNDDTHKHYGKAQTEADLTLL